MSTKYPRTPHLPWSPGGTRDDRKIESVDSLIGIDLVITEKIDGSNICFTRDNVFARSHSGAPTHESFGLAKAKHAEIRHSIMGGLSIFAEYTYAVHSIEYTQMTSPIWVIGVRLGERWLDFDLTEEWATKCGLVTVPVVFRGSVKGEEDLRFLTESLSNAPSLLGGTREGVVVRTLSSFVEDRFGSCVAKYVRKDHVQTDEHWSRNWKKQDIK